MTRLNFIFLSIVSYLVSLDIYLFVPNYYLLVFFLGMTSGCLGKGDRWPWVYGLTIFLITCNVLWSYWDFLYGLLLFPGLSTILFAVSHSGFGKLLKHKPEWKTGVFLWGILLYYFVGLLLIFQDHFVMYGYWAIAVFGSTIFLLKKGWRHHQISMLILPVCALFLIPLLDQGIFFSIVGYLIAIPSGLLLGFLAMKGHQFTIVSIFALFLGLIVLYFGLKNWAYLDGLEAFTQPVPSDQFLFHGDTVTLNDFKGEVLLLDFWNTRCGTCFKKFPELDKFNETYKNRHGFRVLSVNIPLKFDSSGEAQSKINHLGYGFEHLYTLDDSTARTKVIPKINRSGKSFNVH